MLDLSKTQFASKPSDTPGLQHVTASITANAATKVDGRDPSLAPIVKSTLKRQLWAMHYGEVEMEILKLRRDLLANAGPAEAERIREGFAKVCGMVSFPDGDLPQHEGDRRVNHGQINDLREFSS